MTSKRSIIFFWALFLVPTLIMAVVAFRLLSHEQERISRSAIRTLSERAKTISETIHLTIEAVQENLEQSLLGLDKTQLEKNLVEWEKINPLVRNVFIYKKSQGLEYPAGGMASTLEERHFITRYDALFSGRINFDFNGGVSREDTSAKGVATSDFGPEKYAVFPQKKTESSRQKLVALSRVAKKAPANEQSGVFFEETEQKSAQRSGWIPWFSENRLCILGWVQKYEDGPIYGIELELMTLLSRLVIDFPKLSEKGAALVLMDGNGKFMHQSGSL
ncbi:MAG: hypothetical protein GY860_05305, partial [Desulfobacteraceae bacterium]|nr:hypothetical protein [Desulfobacteraceae bacterium]